jgi:hypothetical protein
MRNADWTSGIVIVTMAMRTCAKYISVKPEHTAHVAAASGLQLQGS